MKHSLSSFVLAILLAFGSQSPATAGELFFGKDNEWVVFQGPILSEEVDGILSQLEDKKPKLILLNSIGGNVSGAVRFARYVRENQMNTWIAKNQTCASACALVFLAGIQRFSEGRLVVHQYLPPAEQANEKIARDKAWISVQRIIGETITLLNSFGTPRFVFERIFNSPNLYEFTEAEMAELTTVTSLDEM
ncbi:MAG: hypothetical protein ABR89_01490 [Rhodobacter sp. BACL10 MAG-120910-bin24]|nr:MAG: hypothetical protein ABR89_01490 [Rhodobacter sp. BACL10 MAG-120910-bin24]